MDENNSEFGAFLAGFVIGGLVGAAAALILAPQSGSETRSQIVGKSQDFREAGGRRAHQAHESASSYVQDFSELASQKGQQVQEQARIVLDAGRKSTNTNDEIGIVSEEDTGANNDDAPAAE
jgi:gas vesicle protein